MVDEFDIWLYDRDAAITLFTWVSARYERGSIVLTSHKSFGEWRKLLGTLSSPRRSWTVCCTTATADHPERERSELDSLQAVRLSPVVSYRN